MDSENIACYTLRNHGYQILARNYRLFGVEIDILALKNRRYYLFEVKQTFRKHFKQGWFPYSYAQWKRQMKAIDAWSLSASTRNRSASLLASFPTAIALSQSAFARTT